jgi:hypothetical protein
MPSKKNCWDIMECGREVNGRNVDESGVCPVATDDELTAANSGSCGGRACWKVKVKVGNLMIPNWSHPEKDCLTCSVFHIVRKEEKDCFIL